MHVYMLSRFSCVRFCGSPWSVAHRVPLSTGFSRQEHWSGLPFLPPGDLSDPRIESRSLMFPAFTGWFFTTRATLEAQHLPFILVNAMIGSMRSRRCTWSGLRHQEKLPKECDWAETWKTLKSIKLKLHTVQFRQRNTIRLIIVQPFNQKQLKWVPILTNISQRTLTGSNLLCTAYISKCTYTLLPSSATSQ